MESRGKGAFRLILFTIETRKSACLTFLPPVSSPPPLFSYPLFSILLSLCHCFFFYLFHISWIHILAHIITVVTGQSNSKNKHFDIRLYPEWHFNHYLLLLSILLYMFNSGGTQRYEIGEFLNSVRLLWKNIFSSQSLMHSFFKNIYHVGLFL